MSAVVFTTQCALAHAPEANLWEERRKSAQYAFLNPKSQTLNHISSFPNVRHGESVLWRIPIGNPPPLHSFSEGGFRGNDGVLEFVSQRYGTVRKVTGPPLDKAKRVVLHIQDIHMNPEAQRNIGKTIQALIENNQAGLIALEGAFAPIDLTPFQTFPHRETIRQVADYLLTENKISGPIHAVLTTNGSSPPITGIDNPLHHAANVRAYQQAARLMRKYKKRWGQLERKLTAKKAKAFNRELAVFDEKVQKYHRGKLALGDYVRMLSQGRGTLTVFLNALDSESSLSFSQVEAERSVVISKLLSKLGREDTTDLMSRALAYRTGQIRHTDFYGYVRRLCEKAGVPLAQFPSMSRYLEYILLAESIDAEKLFEEIRLREKEIHGRLAKTEDERALIAESRKIYLVGKLLDFALTKEEWEEYSALSLELGAWWEGIDLSSFEAFHQEAERRDQLMAENFLNQIHEPSTKHKALSTSSILVTGGFHSKGIEKRLTEAGATVVTFVPKITKVETENGSAYLSVFNQEKTPLEKLFEGEKLFLAMDPTKGVSELPVLAQAREFWTSPLKTMTAEGVEIHRTTLVQLLPGLADRVERVKAKRVGATTVQVEIVLKKNGRSKTLSTVVELNDNGGIEQAENRFVLSSTEHLGEIFHKLKRFFFRGGPLMPKEQWIAQTFAPRWEAPFFLILPLLPGGYAQWLLNRHMNRTVEQVVLRQLPKLFGYPFGFTVETVQKIEEGLYELGRRLKPDPLELIVELTDAPALGKTAVRNKLRTENITLTDLKDLVYGDLNGKGLGYFNIKHFKQTLDRYQIPHKILLPEHGESSHSFPSLNSNRLASFLTLSALFLYPMASFVIGRELALISLFGFGIHFYLLSKALIFISIFLHEWGHAYADDPNLARSFVRALEALHLYDPQNDDVPTAIKKILWAIVTGRDIQNAFVTSDKKAPEDVKRIAQVGVLMTLYLAAWGFLSGALLLTFGYGFTNPFVILTLAVGSVNVVLLVLNYRYGTDWEAWRTGAAPAVGYTMAKFSGKAIQVGSDDRKLDRDGDDIAPISRLLTAKPHLKAFNGRWKLTPFEADLLALWIINQNPALFPAPALFEKFWGRFVIERSREIKESRGRISELTKRLSEKWGIKERTMNSLLLWFVSIPIDVAAVSTDLLMDFMESTVGHYRENPFLREKFKYMVPAEVTSPEKLAFALNNQRRLVQMFTDRFIKGKSVFKAPIEGTPYFLGLKFGFAEGPFGFSILVGEERRISENPLDGFFMRIGLDTQDEKLRVITIKGLKGSQAIINAAFPGHLGLGVGRALLHVAAALAERHGFHVLQGMKEELHPTTGQNPLNYQAIFKGFGMRKKSSFGPWETVSHLRQRSHSPGNPKEAAGINLMLQAYSQLQEIVVANSARHASPALNSNLWATLLALGTVLLYQIVYLLMGKSMSFLSLSTFAFNLFLIYKTAIFISVVLHEAGHAYADGPHLGRSLVRGIEALHLYDPQTDDFRTAVQKILWTILTGRDIENAFVTSDKKAPEDVKRIAEAGVLMTLYLAAWGFLSGAILVAFGYGFTNPFVVLTLTAGLVNVVLLVLNYRYGTDWEAWRTGVAPAVGYTMAKPDDGPLYSFGDGFGKIPKKEILAQTVGAVATFTDEAITQLGATIYELTLFREKLASTEPNSILGKVAALQAKIAEFLAMPVDHVPWKETLEGSQKHLDDAQKVLLRQLEALGIEKVEVRKDELPLPLGVTHQIQSARNPLNVDLMALKHLLTAQGPDSPVKSELESIWKDLMAVRDKMTKSAEELSLVTKSLRESVHYIRRIHEKIKDIDLEEEDHELSALLSSMRMRITSVVVALENQIKALGLQLSKNHGIPLGVFHELDQNKKVLLAIKEELEPKKTTTAEFSPPQSLEPAKERALRNSRVPDKHANTRRILLEALIELGKDNDGWFTLNDIHRHLGVGRVLELFKGDSQQRAVLKELEGEGLVEIKDQRPTPHGYRLKKQGGTAGSLTGRYVWDAIWEGLIFIIIPAVTWWSAKLLTNSFGLIGPPQIDQIVLLTAGIYLILSFLIGFIYVNLHGKRALAAVNETLGPDNQIDRKEHHRRLWRLYWKMHLETSLAFLGLILKAMSGDPLSGNPFEWWLFFKAIVVAFVMSDLFHLANNLLFKFGYWRWANVAGAVTARGESMEKAEWLSIKVPEEIKASVDRLLVVDNEIRAMRALTKAKGYPIYFSYSNRERVYTWTRELYPHDTALHKQEPFLKFYPNEGFIIFLSPLWSRLDEDGRRTGLRHEFGHTAARALGHQMRMEQALAWTSGINGAPSPFLDFVLNAFLDNEVVTFQLQEGFSGSAIDYLRYIVITIGPWGGKAVENLILDYARVILPFESAAKQVTENARPYLDRFERLYKIGLQFPYVQAVNIVRRTIAPLLTGRAWWRPEVFLDGFIRFQDEIRNRTNNRLPRGDETLGSITGQTNPNSSGYYWSLLKGATPEEARRAGWRWMKREWAISIGLLILLKLVLPAWHVEQIAGLDLLGLVDLMNMNIILAGMGIFGAWALIHAVLRTLLKYRARGEPLRWFEVFVSIPLVFFGYLLLHFILFLVFYLPYVIGLSAVTEFLSQSTSITALLAVLAFGLHGLWDLWQMRSYEHRRSRLAAQAKLFNDILGLIRLFQAPPERGKKWMRLSASMKEAFDFNHWWQQHSSQKPDQIFEFEFAGRIYRIHQRALDKARMWLDGSNRRLQNYTPGIFDVQDPENYERLGGFVARPTDQGFEITDFLPRGSYAVDPSFGKSPHDPNIRQLVGPISLTPDQQALGIYNEQYEIKPPEGTVLLDVHSHPAWSQYPDGPSGTDRKAIAANGRHPAFMYGLQRVRFFIFEEREAAEIGETPILSPRTAVFSQHRRHFDENGLAVDHEGRTIAVHIYQLALDEFISRLQAIHEFEERPIDVQVKSLHGSVAFGWGRLGIFPPHVSYEDASLSLISIKKLTVPEKAELEKAHGKPILDTQRYPSDLDVDLSIEGDVPTALKAARAASEQIFKEYGVFIHPFAGLLNNKAPLGRLEKNGLEKFYLERLQIMHESESVNSSGYYWALLKGATPEEARPIGLKWMRREWVSSVVLLAISKAIGFDVLISALVIFGLWTLAHAIPRTLLLIKEYRARGEPVWWKRVLFYFVQVPLAFLGYLFLHLALFAGLYSPYVAGLYFITSTASWVAPVFLLLAYVASQLHKKWDMRQMERPKKGQRARLLTDVEARELALKINERLQGVRPFGTAAPHYQGLPLTHFPSFVIDGQEIKFESNQPQPGAFPTVVRVGPLIFIMLPVYQSLAMLDEPSERKQVAPHIIRKGIEDIKNILGDLYQAYSGNIIFTDPDVYNANLFNQGIYFSPHVAFCLAQMVARAKRFRGVHVGLGAGTGKTEMAALALGSEKAVLIENDAGSNQLAPLFLEASGWRPDIDFVVINKDLSSVFLANEPLLAQVETTVADIGDPAYGNANNAAVDLASSFPSLQLFINGGMLGPYPTLPTPTGEPYNSGQARYDAILNHGQTVFRSARVYRYELMVKMGMDPRALRIQNLVYAKPTATRLGHPNASGYYWKRLLGASHEEAVDFGWKTMRVEFGSLVILLAISKAMGFDVLISALVIFGLWALAHAIPRTLLLIKEYRARGKPVWWKRVLFYFVQVPLAFLGYLLLHLALFAGFYSPYVAGLYFITSTASWVAPVFVGLAVLAYALHAGWDEIEMKRVYSRISVGPVLSKRANPEGDGFMLRYFFTISISSSLFGGWRRIKMMVNSFGGNLSQLLKSLSRVTKILDSLLAWLAISTSEVVGTAFITSWPFSLRNRKRAAGTFSSSKNRSDEDAITPTFERGNTLGSSHTLPQSAARREYAQALVEGNSPVPKFPRSLFRLPEAPEPHTPGFAFRGKTASHGRSRGSPLYRFRQSRPFSSLDFVVGAVYHLSGTVERTGFTTGLVKLNASGYYWKRWLGASHEEAVRFGWTTMRVEFGSSVILLAISKVMGFDVLISALVIFGLWTLAHAIPRTLLLIKEYRARGEPVWWKRVLFYFVQVPLAFLGYLLLHFILFFVFYLPYVIGLSAVTEFLSPSTSITALLAVLAFGLHGLWDLRQMPLSADGRSRPSVEELMRLLKEGKLPSKWDQTRAAWFIYRWTYSLDSTEVYALARLLSKPMLTSGMAQWFLACAVAAWARFPEKRIDIWIMGHLSIDALKSGLITRSRARRVLENYIRWSMGNKIQYILVDFASLMESLRSYQARAAAAREGDAGNLRKEAKQILFSIQRIKKLAQSVSQRLDQLKQLESLQTQANTIVDTASRMAERVRIKLRARKTKEAITDLSDVGPTETPDFLKPLQRREASRVGMAKRLKVIALILLGLLGTIFGILKWQGAKQAEPNQKPEIKTSKPGALAFWRDIVTGGRWEGRTTIALWVVSVFLFGHSDSVMSWFINAFFVLTLLLHKLIGVKVPGQSRPAKDWTSAMEATVVASSSLLAMPVASLGIDLIQLAMELGAGIPGLIAGLWGASVVALSLYGGGKIHEHINRKIQQDYDAQLPANAMDLFLSGEYLPWELGGSQLGKKRHIVHLVNQELTDFLTAKNEITKMSGLEKLAHIKQANPREGKVIFVAEKRIAQQLQAALPVDLQPFIGIEAFELRAPAFTTSKINIGRLKVGLANQGIYENDFDDMTLIVPFDTAGLEMVWTSAEEQRLLRVLLAKTFVWLIKDRRIYRAVLDERHRYQTKKKQAA